MTRHIPDKLKIIFTDTIWSIAGLVLMNVAAQFVVYPYLNRVLGPETYGNIVYLLAIMNILAISIGSGINYTRMRQSADGETGNRVYLLLMKAGSVISVLLLLVMKLSGILHLNTVEFNLFCLLTVVTMWRYYADVEYRLHINYKGYFLYYLVIGIGYLAGIFLFMLWELWPITLLPGEIAGLVLVRWKGSIFKTKCDREKEYVSSIIQMAMLLVGTNVLTHLIFNGDRILLQWFAGSTAVTIYYIASLFGKTMTLITTPLNGVLVGHLAKFDGKLTRNLMNQIVGITIGAAAIVIVGCCIVSSIVLPLLYPKEYTEVSQYLILANAAQVVYFVGNVLTASVLLRFTRARNQLIVNAVHGVLFVVICIPLTWRYEIDGFCWGLLSVNIIRLAFCIVLGYEAVRLRGDWH